MPRATPASGDLWRFLSASPKPSPEVRYAGGSRSLRDMTPAWSCSKRCEYIPGGGARNLFGVVPFGSLAGGGCGASFSIFGGL